MDIWERERTLARTTLVWGGVSLVAGLAGAAATRDPWRRSFGLQSAGWGAVDLAIVVVVGRLQDRRMRAVRDSDAADAAAAQEAERVSLRRILALNAVADVGYVVLGGVLARDPRPRVAGAGAAIVVQGAFLLGHDTYHAVQARPGAT